MTVAAGMARNIRLGGVVIGLLAVAASSALAAEEPAEAPANTKEPVVTQVASQASVPPPPAPVILAAEQRREPGPPDTGEPATFLVVVTKGRERILAESLAVGGGTSASINRSKSQYAGPCPGDETKRSSRSLRESLSLSIYPVRWRRGEEGSFNVNLAIQIPQSACGADGVNSLGISRSLVLAAGASQVLEGPDGLVMRITRRK